MKLFQLTNAAKKDLKGIAIYSENIWGKAQRNIYLKQFDDVFHLLAENSELGGDCEYIKEGYKKFPQGSHMIYYIQGATSKILIVRILHKRMDEITNLEST